MQTTCNFPVILLQLQQTNLSLSHRENASSHVTPDVSSSEISSSLSSVANGAELSLA